MENFEQNPVNLQGAPIQNNNQNPIPNNSDFAQKQPLIDPKTLSLLKKLGITFFSLIMVLVVGLVAYNMMPEKTPIASVNLDENLLDDNNGDSDNIKYFAYIKDDKAIWIADTSGENKKVIFEIPTSSTAIVSTITWKSPRELTFSLCTALDSSCEVRTINIDDKSVVSEFATEKTVRKITWDKTSQYIAFIEDQGATTASLTTGQRTSTFRLKTGTIFNDLETFFKYDDPTNINSRVLFSTDNQYIVYYGIRKIIKKAAQGQSGESFTVAPLIQIYLLNGTKVDEIDYAKDPFFITENKLGYIKEDKIVYKTIGLQDETIATAFNGYTPQISPDKNLIAYWHAEGSLSNVVLGVFDTTLNIHRNILRGIILPYWISDSQIIGIKADNCLGSSCQLYEFKTNSISLVDISRGNVVQIDQGRRISEPSYVFFEDKNAD